MTEKSTEVKRKGQATMKNLTVIFLFLSFQETKSFLLPSPKLHYNPETMSIFIGSAYVNFQINNIVQSAKVIILTNKKDWI